MADQSAVERVREFINLGPHPTLRPGVAAREAFEEVVQELTNLDDNWEAKWDNHCKRHERVERDLRDQLAEAQENNLRVAEDKHGIRVQLAVQLAEANEKLEGNALTLSVMQNERNQAQVQLAEATKKKDTYRCSKCLHVFPYQSLGVPCPHCMIEELQRRVRELEGWIREATHQLDAHNPKMNFQIIDALRKLSDAARTGEEG